MVKYLAYTSNNRKAKYISPWSGPLFIPGDFSLSLNDLYIWKN
jgi:hypothetical protein